MIHEKASFTKELFTAIQECWNPFEEYYFKLVKSRPERIKAVIKAKGRATKN